MSIHDGHRERVKNRYQTEGLDGFAEHQVLELMLFYCLPRQDTNPLAHALLERFGSLADVLDASVEELMQVPGVGTNTARFLRLFRSVERYCSIHCRKQDTILNTVTDCKKYLIPYFTGKKNESVYLLSMDAKRKVISCKEVGEGSVNSAAVPIRRIVEMSLAANASTVILSHNHPSGLAVPSAEDIHTTRKLAMALDSVGIELTDHIIVADGDCVSLVQSGFYDPEDCHVLL